MEGFEHVVKVAMESEGLVVTGNVKFPVKRRTRKKSGQEFQTHGYEIDLIGARGDRLVLASVKSYFGSRGVSRQGFRGLAKDPKEGRFKNFILFNDEELRDQILQRASQVYGYAVDQIEIRLYVGKFANDDHREDIEQHLTEIHAGCGPIRVYGLDSILEKVLKVLNHKTYFNDPVVAVLRALKQAGKLTDFL